MFPAFADPVLFPTERLQLNWDMATCFISDKAYPWCGVLVGTCRESALYLMTAHLTALGVIIAAGDTPGIVNSATIDKITVSLTPPPLKNGWQWWMSTTPYGAELWSLLQVKSAGGWYVGGSAPLLTLDTPYRNALYNTGRGRY